MTYWDAFEFSAQITLPIFMIVLLGYLLFRVGFLNDAFIEVGSKLVFTVALPTLIFLKIAALDWQSAVNGRLIIFAILASVIFFVICWWIASALKLDLNDKGVFVQGAGRSNLGIIGLALCVNAFGESGLGVAALLLALVTAAYNVICVVVLSVPMQQLQQKQQARMQNNGDHHPRKVRTIDVGALAKGIITNPLIIGILLAFVYSLSGVEFPSWTLKSADNIASLTLPLALLCIGASLDLKVLRNSSQVSYLATLLKLVVMPLMLTLAAYAVGIRSIELAVLCLFFASPTAAASFVMVKGIGGNAAMSANIIVLSTLCSLVTTSIALFMLRILGVA